MSHYLSVRQEWLSKHNEAALEPDMPIVDAHHHVWDVAGWRYMFDDLLADVRSGHRIVSSVFVQCYSMYRKDGQKELRACGETEFANGVAAMSASGMYGEARLCEGIVGTANLTAGDGVQKVLEAHLRIAARRFKGIRQITAWDGDEEVHASRYGLPQGIMDDSAFRAGLTCLGRMGLSFDAYVFHTQLGELTTLARANPEVPIILNHVGGPVGIGRFKGQRDEVIADWKASIAQLAECPNVSVKLGGLGMKTAGFDFHERSTPPDSDMLASAWRPYIAYCIDKFSPSRCMFESNFPVDKGSCSYTVLWNAFKKIANGYTRSERLDLFAGTAARIYRLETVSATLSEESSAHAENAG
jgi:L-fuconolactonase